MFIIATVIMVIAIAILAIMAYNLDRTLVTYHEALNDQMVRNKQLEHRVIRETDVNKLLMAVLSDMAHEKRYPAIVWKLAAIRRVEYVVRSYGYGSDEIYQWLKDMLSGNPSGTRDELMEKIRDQVSDYYLLSDEVGKPILEILETMVDSMDKNRPEESRDESMRRLMDQLKKIKFKLPLVDTEDNSNEHPMEEATPEDLFTRMEKISEEIQKEIDEGRLRMKKLEETDNEKEEKKTEGTTATEQELDHVGPGSGGTDDTEGDGGFSKTPGDGYYEDRSTAWKKDHQAAAAI